MKKLLILLILILLAAACGRGNNEDYNEAAIIGIMPDGDTITIAVSMFNERQFRIAADNLIAHMALEGREVSVEFITYMQGEEYEHYNRIFGMLAAGIGPDIMIVPDNMRWALIQNGLLADINNFINKNDFYENVLSAYEINGRLYSMPLSFGFNFIGINGKVPQSFIDRFAALEYINIMDIATMYNDLIYEYPEFAEYSIIRGLWPSSAILLEIGQNIDFNERTANFGHLYSFSANLMQIFENNRWIDLPHVFPPTDESAALLAAHYIFSLQSDPVEAMFPFHQAFFVHYIPLADMHGRLIDSTFLTASVSISSTAPPLAGAFLEQLLISMEGFNSNIPVRRHNMRHSIEEAITRTLNFREPRPFTGDRFVNIQNILNRLEAYAERPIAAHMRILPDIFEFIDEQTFTELEEFIISWLNEVPVIEVYIPEPPPVIPDELTQRTLTIRAGNRYREVIEQARDMLNVSLQGMGYYLSINFELHESVEWPGEYPAWRAALQARDMRLRTELMAGMGPDLILVSNHDEFTLHQFTSHLTDFYNLINNCEFTSLDDFFIYPLKANEFMGGLFEMPMMFGFHYIGINDNMPDSIINTFTRFSRLRGSDMINLYFDFLENYNEFLYLGISHHQLFLSNIMNYIDANAVDFNSPGFIESFILQNRIEWGVHNPTYFTTTLPINLADRVRPLGGTQMFFGDHMSLNPADAFLDRDIPFSHFIPLANDYGCLVVRFSSPLVWIPTAGDVSLAWKLTRYLIAAFSEPIGRAAVLPGGFGLAAPWGSNTLHAPIMRSLFENHMQAAFNNLRGQHGFSTGEEFDIAAQNAIERIYKYANMSMVIPRPHLPIHLILEPLEYFSLGLIGSQEAITRVQNALTLWLME